MGKIDHVRYERGILKVIEGMEQRRLHSYIGRYIRRVVQRGKGKLG